VALNLGHVPRPFNLALCLNQKFALENDDRGRVHAHDAIPCHGCQPAGAVRAPFAPFAPFAVLAHAHASRHVVVQMQQYPCSTRVGPSYPIDYTNYSFQ
jgi:hypothetical protein